MIELGISIAAIAAIFYGGIQGSREGLFRAFTRFCIGLLGLIVAMRCWYPGTMALADQLSVSAEQVSFFMFWVVYALLLLPFLAVLKSLNHDVLPEYPTLLENFAGFILGAANGAVLVSALVLSLTLNIPKFLPDYDQTKLLLPIQRLPKIIYREAEDRLAPASANSPSHTWLPALEKPAPDAPLQVAWK